MLGFPFCLPSSAARRRSHRGTACSRHTQPPCTETLIHEKAGLEWELLGDNENTPRLAGSSGMPLELLKTEITLYKADDKSFWQLHAPVLLQTVAPDGRPSRPAPALPTSLTCLLPLPPTQPRARLLSHPFCPSHVPTALAPLFWHLQILKV